MAEFTKYRIIEELKASTQNANGMFEISEDTICALMSMLTSTAPQLPQPAVLSVSEGVLKSLLPDVEKSEFWFEHNGKIFFEGVRFNNAVFEACRAAMLQAEPVSNSDELPLDYLQGHKDGLEWAAQLAEANHPQTGDWLYDDPIDLARAIRKGPDMPTVQGGNSPVIPNGWKLVPIDPTKDMLRAGQSVVGFWLNTVHCYSKMLAAAPAAPQQEAKNV